VAIPSDSHRSAPDCSGTGFNESGFLLRACEKIFKSHLPGWTGYDRGTGKADSTVVLLSLVFASYVMEKSSPLLKAA